MKNIFLSQFDADNLGKTATLYAIAISAILLPSIFGCSTHQTVQLTQQQKDQIKKEIKLVSDSIISRFEKLDAAGCFQIYYTDSPDWGMVNADGSRWDYQKSKQASLDFFKSVAEYNWTTIRQDFLFFTNDIVTCAWDGKDETILKSGDKVTINPHAYTMVFKRIAGDWKVIYSHDSGIPLTKKANQNQNL